MIIRWFALGFLSMFTATLGCLGSLFITFLFRVVPCWRNSFEKGYKGKSSRSVLNEELKLSKQGIGVRTKTERN